MGRVEDYHVTEEEMIDRMLSGVDDPDIPLIVGAKQKDTRGEAALALSLLEGSLEQLENPVKEVDIAEAYYLLNWWWIFCEEVPIDEATSKGHYTFAFVTESLELDIDYLRECIRRVVPKKRIMHYLAKHEHRLPSWFVEDIKEHLMSYNENICLTDQPPLITTKPELQRSAL